MNSAPNELDFFFDEMADYDFGYAGTEAENSSDKPRKKNYITTFDPQEVYTPAERIERLMSSVKSTSKVLVSTLELCRQMQPVAAVSAHIDALQTSNASVYSAETLCRLLEEAGALTRVFEDGTLACEQPSEPLVVEEDGETYLKVPESKPSFWLISADGAAFLDAYNPASQLQTLLAEQANYAAVFQLVLETCAVEGGATAQQLADLINKRDDVQSPRRYSSYFVDQLQECLALEWAGKAWHTTNLGKSALL